MRPRYEPTRSAAVYLLLSRSALIWEAVNSTTSTTSALAKRVQNKSDAVAATAAAAVRDGPLATCVPAAGDAFAGWECGSDGTGVSWIEAVRRIVLSAG